MSEPEAKQENAVPAVKKEDVGTAKDPNATMCVYHIKTGKPKTVPYDDGKQLLKSKEWVDSPAKCQTGSADK